MQILRLACRWLCMSNYSVENIPRGVLENDVLGSLPLGNSARNHANA